MNKNKTYVGAIVYAAPDGKVRPERIVLGNTIYSVTGIVDAVTKGNVTDYTVEIWGSKNQKHIYREKTRDAAKWYVLEKEPQQVAAHARAAR